MTKFEPSDAMVEAAAEVLRPWIAGWDVPREALRAAFAAAIEAGEAKEAYGFVYDFEDKPLWMADQEPDDDNSPNCDFPALILRMGDKA